MSASDISVLISAWILVGSVDSCAVSEPGEWPSSSKKAIRLLSMFSRYSCRYTVATACGL